MISSPAAAEFDDLANALAVQGATRGQMMGRPVLSIGGRMFACLDGPALGVKLGRETPEFAEALDVPGAAVFSPGNSERKFFDWVALPLDAVEEWERFATAAKEYIAARPGKR